MAYVFLDRPDAEEDTPTKGKSPFHRANSTRMSRKQFEATRAALLPSARKAFAGRSEPDQPATIAHGSPRYHRQLRIVSGSGVTPRHRS